ncbi:amidohydrolase [Lachnobacterium bovis]|uniref:amidohydrolase n=1 Tax=Lachnobacterium bovis TaxID=140626 RepID=UPI0003B5801C|nr:amidohydrolase [Lachnobacterium bovis]
MNIRFYNARIVVPKEENEDKLEVIFGEVWVKKDTIVYVGNGKNSENVCKENDIIIWNREIDVKGNVLIPGFKNAHTHTAMTFLRSYADDVPLQEWLQNHIFPKEALLKEEDAYYLNVLGIMEYLTSGITTSFDMYLYPYATAKAAYNTGFRTMITSGLNNFTSSVKEVEEQYLKINEMSDRIKFVPGFHAEYTCSKELLEELSVFSNKYKLPVWTHNSETSLEVKECKERWGMSPTKFFDELGLHEYGGGGYHCIWMDDGDYDIFKKHNMSMITCPASNLKLNDGIAPITTFRKNGIKVGIGTDGPSSNNCLDMFREMFLVSGLANIKDQTANSINAEDVLKMAIKDGADAMGISECNAIAVGKKADIVMIDLNQPNMQPINNIIKNIVYSGSKTNVKMTVVNGEILYEDGQFNIGIDPVEVYEKANSIIREME